MPNGRPACEMEKTDKREAQDAYQQCPTTESAECADESALPEGYAGVQNLLQHVRPLRALAQIDGIDGSRIGRADPTVIWRGCESGAFIQQAVVARGQRVVQDDPHFLFRETSKLVQITKCVREGVCPSITPPAASAVSVNQKGVSGANSSRSGL